MMPTQDLDSRSALQVIRRMQQKFSTFLSPSVLASMPGTGQSSTRHWKKYFLGGYAKSHAVAEH